MPKLITGFLIGVAVTLAMVSWLGSAPEVQQRPVDEASHPEATSRTSPVDYVNDAEETNQESLESPQVSTLAEPDSNDESLQQQAQPDISSRADARTMSAAQRSSTRTSSQKYPPEIAEMIDNSVDKELQARYENDEREDSWAPYMEGLLAAYFAQKPELAQFYFSLIDCRTSVCEIHALGYGMEALTQWNTATADIVSQPWLEFSSMSMNHRNPEPDILAIVLILTKEPAD